MADSKEVFIEKAVTVHGNTYDYSSVEYVRSKTKVAITCKIHGIFYQEPSTHLKGRGCPECGRVKISEQAKAKYNTQWFIDKANAIHDYKYSYDKCNYITNNVKVTIECPIHGEFEQQPRSHLKGNGCKQCANANNNYWSYSGWKKAGEASKFFDGYKVYIIRCYNDQEEFYKIGKTYNPIWLRFSRGQMPYEYEVIKIIEGSAIFICELEQELLNQNYKYRYTPAIKFGGSLECFKSLEGIKEKINNGNK